MSKTIEKMNEKSNEKLTKFNKYRKNFSKKLDLDI